MRVSELTAENMISNCKSDVNFCVTYFPLAPQGDGFWAAFDEFCKAKNNSQCI